MNIRNILLALGACMLLALCITFGLYKSNQMTNFQRMQDTVAAIAKTGVLQLDYRDLEQLQKKEDYLKPEWTKVTNTLKDIRTGNTDVMYVYLFRKSKTNSGSLEFISDSHSLDPFANVDDNPANDFDTNRDGKIDGSPTGGDYLQWPGQPYPAIDLVMASFSGVESSTSFYEDQWGKMVTGFAPIRDEKGEIAAVLAVDMQATKLRELSQKTFAPLLVFFGLMICFIFMRVMAYLFGW